MKIYAEEKKGKYFAVIYGTEHEIVLPEKKTTKKSSKKSSKKK